ncbi:hypothetical protein CWI39_2852p0010 [Hamiltosporidium magnivora]|uniref:Uncharacterized protein n=1 Tax=Hamiltosporidium magnivora TaxID=148818 RepID=A0A4Q9KS89_9MICR|nr:hypothetical protein CWI39_2852p0010 [Hamiltosporidium magnivora]
MTKRDLILLDTYGRKILRKIWPKNQRKIRTNQEIHDLYSKSYLGTEIKRGN